MMHFTSGRLGLQADEGPIAGTNNDNAAKQLETNGASLLANSEEERAPLQPTEPKKPADEASSAQP